MLVAQPEWRGKIMAGDLVLEGFLFSGGYKKHYKTCLII